MPGQLSRPPMVTPWGKCTESVKVQLPAELEEALHRRANAAGVSLSEVIRNVLPRDVFGDAMVEAWLLQQFRSTVRTGPGTQPEAAA